MVPEEVNDANHLAVLRYQDTMNYNDHSPPHYHAEYQGYEVLVDVATGAVTGAMPRRALNLIWS